MAFILRYRNFSQNGTSLIEDEKQVWGRCSIDLLDLRSFPEYCIAEDILKEVYCILNYLDLYYTGFLLSTPIVSYDAVGFYNKWRCNELPFTHSYTIDENGTLVQSELLEWDGQTVAVDLAFRINTYCVYPENSYHHDDRLFSGTWEYRDGNLVLTLIEDFAFDMKYTELTFMPNT